MSGLFKKAVDPAGFFLKDEKKSAPAPVAAPAAPAAPAAAPVRAETRESRQRSAAALSDEDTGDFAFATGASVKRRKNASASLLE